MVGYIPTSARDSEKALRNKSAPAGLQKQQDERVLLISVMLFSGPKDLTSSSSTVPDESVIC